MLSGKHGGDRWQNSRDRYTSWSGVAIWKMRTGGGLFSTPKPNAFLLSMNGTIRTCGGPAVQIMELRSLISTLSLPRVKRPPKQSYCELSKACSRRVAARMPKGPKGQKRPADVIGNA